MQKTNLIFTRWLERASQGSKIMTKIEGISEKQLARITELQNERELGINVNGNKVKWTGPKEEELTKLIDFRDQDDYLPKGAISHLDDVFRELFWKRKRTLDNKYLKKGLMQEDDAVGLKSTVDGEFYIKNEQKFYNEYVCGTPDIVLEDMVIDTKCNYDLESFEKAELTSSYEWQLKIYLWLTGKTQGRLSYCLVNNLVTQISNETTRRYYALGNPDNDDPEWIEERRLIERNMIFDIPLFKKQNPYYVFENDVLDFDIPAHMRVKDFDVSLDDEDITNLKSRIVLSREYLVKKEIATYERMKS